MAKTQNAPKKFPMKWVAIGVIILIVLILVSTVWGSYNNLARLDQGVNTAWADVEVQYQRRIDLIPNLVNTLEASGKFEQSTLVQLSTLRTQWQTAPTINEKVQTSNQIESAISKLLVVSENYPTLQTSAQFQALSDSLTETENMVMVSRNRYNAAVRDYNTATVVFPSNVIAGWFGFAQRAYFEAITPGAENAPVVNITI